jgi:hypothetical protein
MFGWLFGSSCPLDPVAKNWVETSLLWMRDEFGADEFYGSPIILPTPQFFPDPYDGSRKSVQVLFDRVCDFMGVEQGLLRLDFFRPADNPLFLVNGSGEAIPTEAAGWYEGNVIRVYEGQMSDPMCLVGTLAHELAHQRLLGEDRIMSEVYDNELLTDLTVVFKGMGIFLANVPRHWDGDYTFWPGTKLRKPEYMTGAMFGYALALLAWIRGNHNPTWAKHVYSGVRSELRQGLRFLIKTGQTQLRPITRRR